MLLSFEQIETKKKPDTSVPFESSREKLLTPFSGLAAITFFSWFLSHYFDEDKKTAVSGKEKDSRKTCGRSVFFFFLFSACFSTVFFFPTL